jgi:hypothetical protein
MTQTNWGFSFCYIEPMAACDGPGASISSNAQIKFNLVPGSFPV